MNPFIKPDGLDHYATRKLHHLTWLQERTVESWLNTIDPTSDDSISEARNASATETVSNPIFQSPAYDDEPEGFLPGSVRILAPNLSGNECERPIYVLILGEWSDGWTWLAPFSNYSAPATDWELISREKAEPLKVLEVWNARTCPDDLLKKSWLVTRISDSLVQDAKKLYRAMLQGEEVIDEALLILMGTKILDSDDPRQNYLQEETQRLDSLTELAINYEASQEDTDQIIPLHNIITLFRNTGSDLALAASRGSDERPLEFYRLSIEDTSIQLIIAEQEKSKGSFVISVIHDTEMTLQDAQIKNAAGEIIATIQNNSAGTSDEPLNLIHNGAIQFTLTMTDGTPIYLSQHDSSK